MAASYPLDFMKVKLSLKKAGETAVSIVSGVLKQHGVSGLYLGITPKLAKSAAQKFVYFYFYEALLQVRQRLSPVPVSALGNLGLALLADYGCVPIVVPLEAITTQVQTAGDGGGMVTTAARMYRRGGTGAFFEGWAAYMAGSFQPALQFGGYEQARNFLLLRSGAAGAAELGATAAFLLGGGTRAVSELLTYPTLVVQYVQQSADHPLKHKGVFGVAAGLWRTEGLAGLYNGIVPQLGQAVLGAAIMMLAREKVATGVRRLIVG